MSRCCLLLVALSVIAAPTALIADDYELAAGESDTLSTAATYDTMTVNGDLTVSDVYLPEGDIVITYRLTDIYDREYWTEKIEK